MKFYCLLSLKLLLDSMIKLISKFIYQLIEKNTNIFSICILMFIALVIYFVVLPRINIDNQEILDTKFFYSSAKAYEVIDEKSKVFRIKYVLSALTIDIIFPIIYSLLFGILLTNLLQDIVSTESIWYNFRLIPFLGGVSDILENICISFLILRYPVKYPIIAIASSQFTSIKWIIFTSSLVSIIILGIRRFILYFFSI